MSEQPKALRLADELQRVAKWSDSEHWDTLDAAAAELLRLHDRLNKTSERTLIQVERIAALEAEAASLRDQNSELDRKLAEMEQALELLCVKCRSNEWGPDTPRKEILNWMHDHASEALIALSGALGDKHD